MRGHPVWRDVPIADRRHRLDAEEESAPEWTGGCRRHGTVERVGTAREICEREYRVYRQIAGGDERYEPRPTDREQMMVDAERREKRQAAATGVERPIAIKQSPLVQPTDDRAEA